MKRVFLGGIFLLLATSMSFSQAVFRSASGGSWNSASLWTRISGTDADGIPDANDDVFIQSGHTVTINSASACKNLTFTGGTISFNSTVTLAIGGNVSVTNSSAINGYNNNHVFQVAGGLTVPSGRTLNVGAVNFTINGTTQVSGNLSISGYGAKPRNFDDIIINSGGAMTCTGQDAYTFKGDFTNNGTFTANSFGTTFAFTSSSGTIGGSGLISFFDVSFNSPANYTNEGNLQIRNSMSGTGTFTNGNGGQMELQNGGPFTVSTFDASATGNTITYTGFGDPTGFSGSYYNLNLNKSSGSLQFSGSPSILNDLTIQNGIFQVGAITVSIGNDIKLEGGEFTPDNSSGVTHIGGDFNISGGEYDHNNGQVNVSGNMLIDGGASIFTGTSTLNITGALDHSAGTIQWQGGTASAASYTVSEGVVSTVNGGSLNISGLLQLDGTMTFSNTGGSKTFGSVLVNANGNWNVTQPNNVTINGDITNNGTFTADPGYGTSLYTLSGLSGTISGTDTLRIRDIVINSPASYSNEGVLRVGNTFTGTGTFANGVGASFIYAGNNSSGTNFTLSNFDASATNNTVVYAALNSNQRWKATSSANNDYYNVVIQTSTGDYQHIDLASNIRVNGTLSIVEGFVRLNSFDLEFGNDAVITGGDASNYIKINGTGVIRQYLSSAGAALNYPLGDNNNYSPITSFTLNSASFGHEPYIDIDVIDANHPNRNTGNLAQGGNDDGVTANDFISRYWSLNGNDLANPNYDVSYQYIDGDITGTEANMIAALYGQPNGASFNDWKDVGSVNAVNNTATMNSATYWGDLYAMDNNLDRLPVELISFKANGRSGSIMLDWITASEENNDYFILERSIDAIQFNELGKIAGHGTTSADQHYSFEDDFPINGRAFYRLKQIDLNGQFHYSEVITVYYQAETQKEVSIKLYPNPVQKHKLLNIELGDFKSTDQAIIKILGINGDVCLLTEWSTIREHQLDVSNLSSGIYLVHVTLKDGTRFSKKIILE